MIGVALADPADWDGWRSAARRLVLQGVPPDQLVWSVGTSGDLFAELARIDEPAGSFNVPRAAVELAQTAILAREPERFALLYTLVWRIHGGDRHLMEQATDPLVHRIDGLARSVRRDIHKMRAFVRFREVADDGATRHVAWFEPDHHIVAANAPFFARRFATMQWSILTPDRSAHWDGTTLRIGPGASPADVPDDDRLADYWRTYFGAIFNPARLKVGAMLSEMPQKYWKNLPEARDIPDMIRTAGARTAAMIADLPTTPQHTRKAAPMTLSNTGPAAPATPYGELAAEAAGCRACKLWEPATQTVFGEGPVDAAIMLVGEQPGDQEDLAGHPFVGPAGQMLDRALAEAGMDRSTLYVTNAVKHFKFTARGKRRIHEKPDTTDIAACRFWLERETALVQPRLTVALGATAARALLGRTVTIGRERGRPIELGPDRHALITVHPSYLLRLPDEDSRAREYAAFVADLRHAASLVPAAAPAD